MIDILVTKVHDKERFFYYCITKFKISINTILVMTRDINRGHKVKLCELPECDVRYLQQYVCDLKVIKSTPMRPRIKPAPFANDEGKFQKKEEPNELAMYHVVITKITTVEMEATNVQINVLLADPNVKSINIQK